MPGLKIAAPVGTAYNARKISSWAASFSTEPLAPERIATKTDSSSSNIVNINTATAGTTRIISRAALTPSRLGIWMSKTSTSRRRVSDDRTAERPVVTAALGVLTTVGLAAAVYGLEG